MASPNIQRVGNFYINMNELITIEITEDKRAAGSFYTPGNVQKVIVNFFMKGRKDPFVIRTNTLKEAQNGVETVLRNMSKPLVSQNNSTHIPINFNPPDTSNKTWWSAV